MSFQAPTHDQFATALKGMRYERTVPKGWKQYAYEVALDEPDGLMIRISSTINVNGGASRKKGENAIDIVLVEETSDSIVLNDQGMRMVPAKKVLRTRGWPKRLRNRVKDLMAEALAALACQECEDEFMVVREGDVECANCGACINPMCPKCNGAMRLRYRKDGKGAFWGCRNYPDCKGGRNWEIDQPQRAQSAEPVHEEPAPDDDDLQWVDEPEEEADDQIDLASDVLEHPLIRDSNAATKLREVLVKDPERALPLILGDKTPSGKPTVEAVLKQRLAKQKKKPRKKVKRRAKRDPRDDPDTGPDVLEGIHLYTSHDQLAGPMASLVQIDEDDDLTVSASAYPHHELAHDTLNQVQSRILDVVEKDCNVVIATSTGTGKTMSAEMVMGDAIERNAKAIFLSPLRAVSQEKYDEWSDEDHPFSDVGVEIVTGDYQLTPAKRKALRRSSVIVMTSEMLDSKTRRMRSEENTWLQRTLVLVVDEAHLLTMPGRGDALEAGLMRFTKHNPHARIVLLSATMPNVAELGTWLTKLNHKPTRVIQSSWRPVKLDVHYVPYPARRGGGSYKWNEKSKRKVAINLLQQHPHDKWIVFVHSKKAGRALVEELREQHEEPEFHSADLDRSKRNSLESRFKHGNLRIVIATSTLAYGINMPARRVLVLGVHRGLDEVDPIDVIQMFGRAGRAGLDDQGDAYLLLPQESPRDHRFDMLKVKFSDVGRIDSTINEIGTLAFHLTAECAEGEVGSDADAVAWHERSLAHHQGRKLATKGSTLSAARVMDELSQCGILDKKGSYYEATMLGRVSSWLYYSPFDVADWCSNFRYLVEKDKMRDDDLIAWALGKVRSAYSGKFLPKEHQQDMANLEYRLRSKGISKLNLPPACLAFEGLLTGVEYKGLFSYQRQLSYDVERMAQAVAMIDQYVLRALGKTYCDLLTMRMKYGCSWTEADLCHIAGVGARRAKLLVGAGITSVEEVLTNKSAVISAVGQKTAQSVIRGAKQLARARGLPRG